MTAQAAADVPGSDDGTPLDRAKLRCFVIGPIGNKLADLGSDARRTYEEALEVYAEVVEPACESVGLVAPVRADGLARAGEITDQIFRRLRDDDVVIADLTGANANVMYELGLRHSKNWFTAQIGEYGRLPFDINVVRTVMFSRSPMGLINARRELEEILQAGLLGEYDPVSATRVWMETAPATLPLPPAAPSQTAELAADNVAEEQTPDDVPGLIDLVASAEDSFDAFSDSVTGISAVVKALGDLAGTTTNEIAQSDARGGGMRGRLTVATRYADGLAKHAEDLEALVEQYEQACSAVSGGTLAMIEVLEGDPAQLDEPEVEQYAAAIRSLARATRESLRSLSGMTASMMDNAKMSRVMRAPTRRVTSALDRFGATSQIIDEWDRRLQALGVPAPSNEEDNGGPAQSG